jgi:hypothetical protein
MPRLAWRGNGEAIARRAPIAAKRRDRSVAGVLNLGPIAVRDLRRHLDRFTGPLG